MCPLSYYQIMRNCKDKRAHRYQMVQYALSHGVKPAARVFGTSPPVVRKWLSRFKEHGYAGLIDLSRRRITRRILPLKASKIISSALKRINTAGWEQNRSKHLRA